MVSAIPLSIADGEVRELVSPSDEMDVEIRLASDSAPIQFSHNRGDIMHAVPRVPGHGGLVEKTVKRGVGLYARPVGGEGKLFVQEQGSIFSFTYNDYQVSDSDVSISPVQDGKFQNQGTVAFGADSVAVAGTAEQLNGGTSQPVPDNFAVLIQGEVSASGDAVYVGDSAVTSADGYPLADGQTVSLQVADVNDLWIDVDTASDGVRWIVEVPA